MILQNRRRFIAGLACVSATAACNNGVSSSGGSSIDRRVETTLDYLYNTEPGAFELSQSAAGMLVMPLVTEVGLGLGGSFGRGALVVDGSTVDYYSAAQASFGLQIGAQQYAHVLFFMTGDALFDFRNSPGWAAGADIEYALNNQGANVSTETTNLLSPVIAVVFGQAGLIAGATIEGTKYTRIIP